MPVTNEAEVVAVDASTLVSRLAAIVDGPLYSVVEYGPSRANVVYADEATAAYYADRDHLVAYLDRVQTPVEADVRQVALFADSFAPVADRAARATTTPDAVTFLRIANDRNGLLVALAPGEPVEPVLAAVEDLCRARADRATSHGADRDGPRREATTSGTRHERSRKQ